MKKKSVFFFFFLPFALNAQIYNFSPNWKAENQYSFHLFKNILNGDKIEESHQNKDTILFHIFINNVNKNGSIRATFRYDFSKIHSDKNPLVDFNYILNKTREGNVEMLLDTNGITITNPKEIQKRYKFIINNLMQKASTEDKMVYEDLLDELDNVDDLGYLILEDFEILNDFWGFSFVLNQRYRVEDEIESPYSVNNIPAEGIITVTKYEHDTTLIDVNIELRPHSSHAKKEMDVIRGFLRGNIINGDKMKDEELFYIEMKYRYLYDIKTRNTLFASKLRILKEGYNTKIKSTIFELVE